ncbi:SDR family NAD(P)-dependent oxidoreductase [Rhodococcus ruber]|uniref:Short-chain dehydrogenase/reductase SDR n=1 Tax=Rhodococcus ruber TaxID=1830 RepID=A0A098BFG2_9NOCA|nr:MULTISPECIES: SDR family NAD(P)-dependent oxidoreductase [Rhodococcus]MDO2377126.1 SDR family NAD(P)-dependent oxidoreductase [Rhodococcus ruber]ATQ29827.1 3-oxoacyl-ACP reductase [Rhodococcus ruber]MCD2124977.1 SDR family NAD(P)-dependent oxidoreductase [Rhodococcus ruber]MCF8785079.1 SDR family NAD(P)-dependent oxidoreductase [Rhodococcus ruber]MCZ1072699.1 SDR family NAD(P)-dependent oxidoreductase [Rhodococcus sp. A5(2022)]
MSDTDLTGRTAVVTGAGSGLGRAEALALAERGAAVVVNDIGAAAHTVAAEIEERGGRAIAVEGDVGTWSIGDRLVDAAVDQFGSLDVVVNNAGIIRDAMLVTMTEAMWDDVIRVHLKGHAALTTAAARYWRAQSKSSDSPVYGRLINTTSEAFLFGGAGQSNYAAAKSGIVALTLAAAQGLSRYGVTANAIAPRARTEMTAHVFDEDPSGSPVDILAPERVATFVAYLACPASSRVNGQVFVVYGDMVALMAPPVVENRFTAGSGVFTVDELDAQVSGYFADRPADRTFSARSVAALDTTGVRTKLA